MIAAAQDVGGEAAAGKWYDAAKATFTTLVDATHTVSSAFRAQTLNPDDWNYHRQEWSFTPSEAGKKSGEIP
ncbi:MAG: hypothetical protein ACRD2I_10635 [Vicinamibacterales bacterium]